MISGSRRTKRAALAAIEEYVSLMDLVKRIFRRTVPKL